MIEAAEKGSGRSRYYLGIYYGAGAEVEKDMKEAVRWLKLAAELGQPAAQDSLAYCYQYGMGVKRDEAAAVALWKTLVLDQRKSHAYLPLANAALNGTGMEKSKIETCRLSSAG